MWPRWPPRASGWESGPGGPLRSWPPRWRPHAAGGLLARLLEIAATWSTAAPWPRRRSRAARRRTGPRRGAGGRGRWVRLLRRVGPEVAVRAERHRLPVRTRGACAGDAAALARLQHAREHPDPFDRSFHEDARRFDTGLPGEHQLEWALAAIDVLVEPGLERLHEHAARRPWRWRQADRCRAHGGAARRLDARLLGGPRTRGAVAALRERGFVLRNLPGTPYVRASVGAWNSEDELDGLLSALPSSGATCRPSPRRRRPARRPPRRRRAPPARPKAIASSGRPARP